MLTVWKVWLARQRLRVLSRSSFRVQSQGLLSSPSQWRRPQTRRWRKLKKSKLTRWPVIHVFSMLFYVFRFTNLKTSIVEKCQSSKMWLYIVMLWMWTTLKHVMFCLISNDLLKLICKKNSWNMFHQVVYYVNVDVHWESSIFTWDLVSLDLIKEMK